jgi:hypothetical protein
MALRERGAAIRAAEMERARRRLGQLGPEQEQALPRRGEVDANDRLVRSVLGLG